MNAIRSIQDIESVVYNWFFVQNLSSRGIAIIWEDQNAPRPTNGQYISLYGPRIYPETETAEFIDSIVDSQTLLYNMVEQTAVMLTVTVHKDAANGKGMTAQDLANLLRRQIRQFDARTYFEPLAVIDTDAVMQVPQLLESQYETRYQFNVRFRLGIQDQGTVETIKEVGATGTLNGASTPVTVPINVTAGE